MMYSPKLTGINIVSEIVNKSECLQFRYLECHMNLKKCFSLATFVLLERMYFLFFFVKLVPMTEWMAAGPDT